MFRRARVYHDADDLKLFPVIASLPLVDEGVNPQCFKSEANGLTWLDDYYYYQVIQQRKKFTACVCVPMVITFKDKSLNQA